MKLIDRNWGAIFGLLLVAAAVGACGGSSDSSDGGSEPSTGIAVSIVSLAFSPASSTISAGTTVTWTNNDSVAHTVTSSSHGASDEGALFNSGTLSSGETFSHTFSSAGTFDYHCHIHPSMTGTITVE